MRIFLNECRKAATSPILIALLVLFCAYNIFLIVSSSNHKEELNIVNDIVDTYGLQITAASLQQFEKNVQTDLTELEKMTGQKFGTVHDFLSGLRFEDRDRYSEADWQFIDRLQIKEMYLGMAESIDESYATIDIEALGEGEVKKYALSGTAANILRKEYKKFAERFEEMVGNEEHKQWFFAGKVYFMHSFLFKTVFLHIIIESLLLVILATALIMNYEFESRTHLVSYATRRGRKLVKDKLAASLMIAAILTAIVLVVTLVTYFIIFDYSHVWKTSISSAFNWEYNFPNIAWWDLSVRQYLVGVIGLVMIGMLLFSGLTSALSIVLKNSYVAFSLMALFFVIAWLMPGFMSTSSRLLFISSYNLSTLLIGISGSFMGSSGLTMFKNFEWMTVASWTIFAVAFCFISIQRFRKEDI
ncbi:carbamoylphosphate synthase large subunit [Bacillus sp. OxB-1]|uniref:hypothetical protein n=1 Tax=Bacillus sp. (strain OxB-1) TaxID=98228 RepID=UPI0005820144|nr:hypothetical protein [Bacillus sp. OxB-1]BAQ10147.1 carbamoylphosphate synthase large subunit [Bacillus sp. OxB-1]